MSLPAPPSLSLSLPSALTPSSPLPPTDLWCNIPPDLGVLICEYLEVDSCGYLLMISKSWPILPTEKIYRQLCFQIFQSQSLKKILNVSQWGGSWRNMLIYRPRLRTNGLYSLRTSYWKPPTNEKFWEEKIREFPETKFYRHLRFFDHGRVLYSLCNLSSQEIYPLLRHCEPQPTRKIFEGSYQLVKDTVVVKVPTHYAEIKFVFLIRNLCASEEGGSDESYAGNHNVLKLTRHSAEIVRQNQTSHVSYELPSYSNFLFHRFWL